MREFVLGVALVGLVTTASPTGYQGQFPQNGIYQTQCEGLSTAVCTDLCGRCAGPYSKPELEDCVIQQDMGQGSCQLDVDWIFTEWPAASWTRLLPNTSFDLTSIIVDRTHFIYGLSELVLTMELTSDVNTQFLNDEYYQIPEGVMPTTTASIGTEEYPPFLSFDAYIMADLNLSQVDTELCPSLRFSASVANVMTSDITYSTLSTPSPLPTPYPYSGIPHLSVFTLDLTELIKQMPFSRSKYFCINLRWNHVPKLFKERSVVSNISLTGRASRAYRIESTNDPELYPSDMPSPHLTCEQCLAARGIACAGNPNKYDAYFQTDLQGDGPNPYTKDARCCGRVSVCPGDLFDCDGQALGVADVIQEL